MHPKIALMNEATMFIAMKAVIVLYLDLRLPHTKFDVSASYKLSSSLRVHQAVTATAETAGTTTKMMPKGMNKELKTV
jgi:hypothetical protein